MTVRGEPPVYVASIEEEPQTQAFARLLAAHLRAGDLVVLSGGLGAGKTFLSREICYALGLSEEEPVTSPTFTLINEYATSPPVLHSDLYRLSDEEEVEALGLVALRDEGNLLLVEWGRPYVKVLGGDPIFVDLVLSPRSVTVTGEGRGAEVARELLHAESGL